MRAAMNNVVGIDFLGVLFSISFFFVLPILLLVTLTLLIRGVVCLVQMLRAKPGSGRRKDLKRSTLRCLITSVVLFVCAVLLYCIIGSLAISNM